MSSTTCYSALVESRKITCTECGTEITSGETTATPLEQREPCPNCESLTRSVHVTGAGGVSLAVTATITAGGVQPQRAEATGAAPDATVETSSGTQQDSLTTIVRPTRTYEIRLSGLRGESCIVEVFDEDHAMLLSGVGLTEVDALIEAIRYLLPRDHPEHPDSTGS